ncbi:MAG: hypothetical protein M5U21_10095 [Fimbriimonadaceae bacterium]|nr:hypothetical protein [Fimbriimonadaceae bacterium]
MRTVVLMALCAGLVVSMQGCFGKKGPEYEPLLDAAPEFGTGNLTTIPAFLEGTWCICSITDMELAKRMGLEAIAEEDVSPNIVYTFKPDGTFRTQKLPKGWVVDGSWKVESDGVKLSYEMVDGVTWDQARANVQKKAETGTQAGILTDIVYETVFKSLPELWKLNLAYDKKRLLFAGTSPLAAMGMGADPAASASREGKGLMRMKEVKN